MLAIYKGEALRVKFALFEYLPIIILLYILFLQIMRTIDSTEAHFKRDLLKHPSSVEHVKMYAETHNTLASIEKELLETLDNPGITL